LVIKPQYTLKALGLAVSTSLFARDDEVIE
jgi:hypothetical protein